MNSGVKRISRVLAVDLIVDKFYDEELYDKLSMVKKYAIIAHLWGTGLFLINMVLYALTMKKSKKNIILPIISIISMIMSYIGYTRLSYIGNEIYVQLQSSELIRIYSLLTIIPVIIQLIIFIILITNILKNRKKEEI